MRRITAGIAASLALSCSASEEAKAPTEVAVVVDGDDEVFERLVRVRASVHALDALTVWKPLEQSEFVLAKQTPPAKGEVTVPISFGIAQGTNPRFELVVEGFSSMDPAATPVIERKVQVTFQPEKRIRVDVTLTSACYDLIKPCSDLSTTCEPQSRACGPVEEATYGTTRPDDSPTSRRSEPDAGAAACPQDHGCPAEYPCVVTGPDSYTCLGQMADWPMPIAGSKVPHQYDSSDARVVVDQVTGLVWQRELPEVYPGCSLANRTVGDWCTWDEAANYCAKLDLAGRSWRLPTKIELESIVDPTQGTLGKLEPVFPPIRVNAFWTSSIARHFEHAEGSMIRAWNVSFFWGNSGFADVATPGGVRCVSTGVVKAVGTPKDRYQVDMQAGTVSDRRTGLTWRRTASPAYMTTLADAQRYCANLGGDFRVPAMKEMMSLFDPTKPVPSISDAFVDPPISFGRAVVARADGGFDEWFVDVYGSSYAKEVFDRIAVNYDLTPPYVLCVR